MKKWGTAGPLVAVLGVVIAAPLFVFLPYLLHEDLMLGPRSGLGTDIAYRHWPDLTYYARVLREERTIPLWDDAVAGGRPLAGDPGVLWLYPFDLIFLVVPPALAFNWLAALHTWIGGVGNYLFLRRGLRLSRGAALLGGAAYMFSPKVISHLAGGHVGLVCGVAWIPWALLGTHRATQGDWKGTLLAGLALALQLPTHVQIPFFTACLMVVYALVRLIASWSSARWKGSLATVVGIVPCFVALSAAHLFPLLGLLPYASRRGFTLQDAAWYALPPSLLLTFLIPTNFQFPEWVLYPGAVSLVLAFVSFFGQRRREAFFWGGVVLFSLLYAIGPATPLFPLLHRVPGFAQLRVPPRIWFMGGFSLTVLAALGVEGAVEEITGRRIRRWRHWVRRLALFIYGGEAVAVIGLLILKTVHWRLLATLVVSLVTIGLLVVYGRGRLRAQSLQIGFVILLLVELVPTARLYTVGVPASEILTETAALLFLRQQPGLWRVYSSRGELPYASAAAGGIEAAEGLLALQMGHYVELIKRASGCSIDGYGTGVPPCLTAEVDCTAYQQARPQPALLGLLNVRYVLTSLTYDDPDLKLVAEFGRERIYENQRWLPRAFVVFQALTLPDQAAVLRALPKADPGRTALLAESLPYLLGEPLPSVSAEVVGRSANSMDVRVQIQQPGLLVVSRTWMPGWRAWVDGQPTRVYRVDYALQGVPLSAGEHEVRFCYQPVGWRLGWPLSLGALAVAITLSGRWALIRYRLYRGRDTIFRSLYFWRRSASRPTRRCPPRISPAAGSGPGSEGRGAAPAARRPPG